MRKLYARLLCLLGLHRYQPHYTERQWFTVKQKKHYRKELQYTCVCCGKPTPWIKLSKQKAFIKSLGNRYGWHVE